MYIAVLTGAGISAESGLPTFRDSPSGLWKQFDPYELSSAAGWKTHPQRIWGYYLWLYHLMENAQPNQAHQALARWHNQDTHEVRVITKNVDNLHEQAGSSPVFHLHGNLHQFLCDTCGQSYTDPLPVIDQPYVEIPPPICDLCGGLIRPNIVLFDEPLPSDAWHAGLNAVGTADLVIIAGTSNLVYPAAKLPELALQCRTPIIEINPHPTALSSQVTCSLRQTASEALPTLLDRLPELLGRRCPPGL